MQCSKTDAPTLKTSNLETGRPSTTFAWCMAAWLWCNLIAPSHSLAASTAPQSMPSLDILYDQEFISEAKADFWSASSTEGCISRAIHLDSFTSDYPCTGNCLDDLYADYMKNRHWEKNKKLFLATPLDRSINNFPKHYGYIYNKDVFLKDLLYPKSEDEETAFWEHDRFFLLLDVAIFTQKTINTETTGHIREGNEYGRVLGKIQVREHDTGNCACALFMVIDRTVFTRGESFAKMHWIRLPLASVAAWRVWNLDAKKWELQKNAVGGMMATTQYEASNIRNYIEENNRKLLSTWSNPGKDSADAP